MNLAAIQEELRNQKLDGWLFFDHHLRDPLAYRVLGFEPPRTPTRRWYYLIPAEGEPRGLEHRIERNMTGPLPGEKIPYSSWTEQVEGLRKITGGLRRVAARARFKVRVGCRESEITEEISRKQFVVMLAGVHQKMGNIRIFLELFNDGRDLHEIRSRANDTEEPVELTMVVLVPPPT